MEEARNLSILMGITSNCSSFHINWAKSAFVGFGQLPEGEAQCSWALGTLTGTSPMCYKDLHLMMGLIKTLAWQAKVLSRGGHLVQLKSVLS